MTRTNRALTTVALALALIGGTAAVAAAAESDPLAQRRALYESELEQNLQARDQLAQRKALYASELEQNLTNAQPVAVDQHDRLLGALEAGQAAGTQAAVEQLRAGERNLDPVPVVTIAPQPVPAAGGDEVGLLPVLLLGLVGGLAGGAAIAALTAASRRHAQRAVAA
jgi:hypothetical protein